MTARSIRRAAERKAVKLARKAALHQPLPAEPLPELIPEPSAGAPEPHFCPQPESQPFELPPPPAASEAPSHARLTANRANAQLSTGPRTPAGKAKVSLNAVKNALTGRTVLLASDDAEAYENHIAAHIAEFQPVGPQETALVQSLAETRWRICRTLRLEMNIFGKGCIEFAGRFNHRPASERPSLIEVETFLVYEKQLHNLQLQDVRLNRRFDKDLAAFRALQQTRLEDERRQLETAAKLFLAAKQARTPFDPAAHGFEFSTPQIERFIQAHPRLFAPAPPAGRRAAA